MTNNVGVNVKTIKIAIAGTIYALSTAAQAQSYDYLYDTNARRMHQELQRQQIENDMLRLQMYQQQDEMQIRQDKLRENMEHMLQDRNWRPGPLDD